MEPTWLFVTIMQDAFWQLTGYQVLYNCKYGFMSTCEYTWATCLLSSGVLSISPAFRADVGGERSTLNMMYFVLCQAFDELAQNPNPWRLPKKLKSPVAKSGQSAGSAGAGQSNPSSALGKRRGRDEPQTKESKKGRSKCRIGLELIQIMVVHEDRVTWQARASNKSLVIVKAYREAFLRDREARCYEVLSSLQGISIPKLMEARYELCDERVRNHALIVSWVGPKQGGNYLTLPTGPLEQARRVIVTMHGLGVAHGDVRLENMNYDFGTGRLFVYDFSHATLREQAGDAPFAVACQEDLLAVEGLISESRTARAQTMRYLS